MQGIATYLFLFILQPESHVLADDQYGLHTVCNYGLK